MVFRKHFIHLILFFSLFLVNSQSFADTSAGYHPHPFETEGGKRAPTFSEANAAAIHWLNLIDQYQFGPSWLDAGNLLKDIITQDQWTAAMEGVRRPLGTVRTRKVENHNLTSSLSHGTQGNFMVISYRTEFSQKANMIEHVILMTEGKLHLWKVVHYQITK